jgi:hypothetical protein
MPFIQIMADLFTLNTDEVDAVDGFIDFFPIKHPALELFDADPQEFFVSLLDLEPSCLIAGEILILHVFVVGIIEKASPLALTHTGWEFLLRPWHFRRGTRTYEGGRFVTIANWQFQPADFSITC